MMAARPFKSLFRGAGRNALDLPVAGLAALAAAFAAFVVPQEILSRAVVATGLPSLFSAAQPPLGLTARVALAVGMAAIVFGLVFLMLRLLDRSGMNASEAKDEDESRAPRVRRRDGHPDAPAPRPISAARDLGEPVPPRAPGAVVPLWLDEAEPVAAPFEPEPEHAFEPEPEPALEAEPAFEPEPVAEIWREPEPIVAPEPELEIVAEAEAEPEVAAAPEPEFEPEPQPEPAPPAEMPTSIAELMARLEQGLANRRMIEPTPVAAAPAAPPQVFPEAPEPADDRLQSAIASLQRLAARSS
jgi:hypothetical protein